jgi:uncharacterized protein YndB with AHSA1/START domain
MNDTQTEIRPIHKSLVVDCSVERAFDVFTRGISSWWPAASYSIGGDAVTEIIIEERVGGRVFERDADGGEGEWGRVLAWDPPARVAMTWYPGHDPAEATELEVSFAADGDRTRVDLVHSGWETRAARAEEARTSYDTGWEAVLAHYTRSLA